MSALATPRPALWGAARRPGWAAFVLATALLSAGCALEVEGELRDVEVTQHDLLVPAAPIEADDHPPVVMVQYAQSPPRLGLPQDALTEVRVLGLAVTVKSGVADLSFINTARVTLQTDDGSPIEIGSYERIDNAEIGPTLLLLPYPPTDVTEAWRAPQLVLTVQVGGQLPTVSWTADVSIRFGAKIRY
jgi:hypothetical protein